VESNAPPKTKGELMLGFVVSPSGDLESAVVTAHNAQLEKCVMTTLKTWKFPQPRPAFSVTVRYPFVFEVAGQ
jgi:TonB family protein